MALAPSPITARTAAPVYTRPLGALNALVSLALVFLLVYSVTTLAHGHLRRGLAELVAFVAARWSVATALATWHRRVSADLRRYWRHQVPAHLVTPRAEHQQSRGELAVAIDDAAEAPFLAVLSVSGRVAMLGLAAVFWAGGWLSFIITITLLAVAVPLYQRAGRRSEAMTVDYNKRRSVLEERQLELLRHAPELQALGGVRYGASEIAAISDAEHTVALRAIRVALESSLITEFLSGVSIGLVAMVVGFALLGGRISLSHALIAVLVTSEVFVQVRRFGVEFHRHETAVRASAQLSTLPSAPTRNSLDATVLLRARDLVTSASDIPLSLDIRRGDRVLVTGRSGSGKTTLLTTCLGWRPPVRGEVTRTATAIGYVSVGSALLSGTLRENLTLDADCSDEELHRVLALLGLRGERFRDLTTIVLPDGRGFSTGERARLILARALVQRATLIMLDDVAGVLDQVARRDVQAALDHYGDVAIVEATVDTPLLRAVTTRIVLP